MGETRRVKYLLVGGGVASASAAAAIRELDAEGTIEILALEPRLPYDRPPMSKGVLVGQMEPEDAESKDPSFYTDKNVKVSLGLFAVSMDTSTRRVELSDGNTVQYEKALLATGATPKRPDLQGIDLQRVHLLRTVDDSLQVRESLRTSKGAAMVGAGYIGMEVASACRHYGVPVTVVEPAGQPWAKFASPFTGDFLRRTFEAAGVQFRLGDEVEGFVGENRVEGVRLKGGETIPCDTAVVGVGVKQNLDLPKQAGLEVDEKEGVYANERLQTSDPDVYVAGDIAFFYDVTVGERWHAEHYLNAKWQGRQAGRNMAGAFETYDRVAYFFSDMLDIHMILRGHYRGGQAVRVFGDSDKAEYVELYSNDTGELAMAIAFSHDEKRLDAWSDKLEELIRAKALAMEVESSLFGLEPAAPHGYAI